MLLLQINLQASTSVSFSVATTDGADVGLGNISVLANSAINTTDGADVSVANTSIVVSGSSSSTDGADVASISVSTTSASVSVSITSPDGADTSNGVIQALIGLSSNLIDGLDIGSAASEALVSLVNTSIDGADIALANIAIAQSSIALSVNTTEDADLVEASLVIDALAVPIGGGYGDEKKKRYIVRKDNQLLVFTNEAQALAAMAYEPVITAPAKRKKKAAPVVAVAAQIVLPAPKPIEQIDLQAIVDLSNTYAAQQEYQFLLKAQEYEALLHLYKKFKQREEEEIVFLLMAA